MCIRDRVTVLKKRRQKHNCCSKGFLCNRTLLQEICNIAPIYSITLALALLWAPPHILTLLPWPCPTPLPCPGTCLPLPRAGITYSFFFVFLCIVLFPHKISPKRSSYCIHLSVSELGISCDLQYLHNFNQLFLSSNGIKYRGYVCISIYNMNSCSLWL